MSLKSVRITARFGKVTFAVRAAPCAAAGQPARAPPIFGTNTTPVLMPSKVSASRRLRRARGDPSVLNGASLRLKDCQRIERRAHSLLDSKRGGRKQELVAIQAPRGFDGAFEIEIVEDVDAERHQRELVDGQTDRRRESGRRDVVDLILADERHAALLQEI